MQLGEIIYNSLLAKGSHKSTAWMRETSQILKIHLISPSRAHGKNCEPEVGSKILWKVANEFSQFPLWTIVDKFFVN